MPHHLPEFETFERLAGLPGEQGGGNLIPLFRRLFADALTPVLAYRRLVRPDQRMAPSFLLESVIGGERVGRYSYLGTRPMLELVARGYDVEQRDHRLPQRNKTFVSEDPLGEMQRLTRELRLAKVEGLPDFTGGWVGYAAYDAVRYLEREKLSDPPPDDRRLPDLHFQLYNDVVAFDHVQKTVLVITHVRVEEHASVRAAYEAGTQQLEDQVRRLVQAASAPTDDACELSPGHVDLAAPPPQLPPSNMKTGGYQEAVRRCKDYIAAGDAFQIVPSQRFDVPTAADPFDIYRALRVVNPSPYMFYLQIDGGMLVGSSPEILCRVEHGEVTNRPLAGTRKRGATSQEDAALERELLADPKDTAEHVMLVDLGRNDVGRVCQPGTIALPEVLQVERYSHVMHLSSTVTGRLRHGLSSWDALRYTLPVGTVSGAPKVRAMQIIDELEPTRRGPYAGAVGYVDFAGNMDMAIALRTMVVTPNRTGALAGPAGKTQANSTAPWSVQIQVGAGIVADSDPDLEHEETVNKAAAMAKAVQLAESAFTI